MTMQEAYEKMREWFTRPGAQLAKGPGGGCFYRGDYSEEPEMAGTKCAVGCLIPDEVYTPTLDETGGLQEWPGERGENPDVAAAWDSLGLENNKDLYDFLLDAQQAHDAAINVQAFVETLDEIAHSFELTLRGVVIVTVRLTGADAWEARGEIRGALEDLRDSGAVFDFSICTSDDPNDHQGDTCPIHEAS